MSFLEGGLFLESARNGAFATGSPVAFAERARRVRTAARRGLEATRGAPEAGLHCSKIIADTEAGWVAKTPSEMPKASRARHGARGWQVNVRPLLLVISCGGAPPPTPPSGAMPGVSGPRYCGGGIGRWLSSLAWRSSRLSGRGSAGAGQNLCQVSLSEALSRGRGLGRGLRGEPIPPIHPAGSAARHLKAELRPSMWEQQLPQLRQVRVDRWTWPHNCQNYPAECINEQPTAMAWKDALADVLDWLPKMLSAGAV